MENMEVITPVTEDVSPKTESAPEKTLTPKSEKNPRKNDLRKTENIIGWVYISPMVIGLLVFTAIPLVMSIMAIFYDWDGIHTLFESEFIGFKNLGYIFGGLYSKEYWQAFANSIIYAIQLPIGMVLGMLLALAMNRDMKGVQVFRVLYYLPGVMSVVAVSIVWNNLFKEGGFINSLIGTQVSWLFEPKPFAFVVNIFLIWKGVGYTTLMFIAGLQSVSTDQIEAAKIDGANSWIILIKITLPALYPTIFYLFVTGLMGSLQMFNEPFLLAGGKGSDLGETAVGFVYTSYFSNNRAGLASAGAWVLALFIFVITAIQLYFDRKKQEAE